jgi:hypothetical protein
MSGQYYLLRSGIMNSQYNPIYDRLLAKFGDLMKDRAVIAYLQHTRAFDAVGNGTKKFDELETEVRKFAVSAGKEYLIYGSRRVTPMEGERKKIRDRAHAVSVLRANEGESDEDLIRFRKEILKGKFLRKGQVKSFIDKNAEVEGHSVYIQIPLSPNNAPRFNKRARAFVVKPKIAGPVVSWTVKYLAYAIPESGEEQLVPVRHGGTLDHLRVLSEQLSKRHGWQSAQASVFVLTGLVPLLPSIRTSFNWNTARFTFDVDLSVTPRQIADYFLRAKRKVLGSHRTKALQQKHMRLAVFAPELSEQDDSTESYKKWNRENPKWRYGNAALFKRDCLQARKRLSDPLGFYSNKELLLRAVGATRAKKVSSREFVWG